jgi:hypothetical protein
VSYQSKVVLIVVGVLFLVFVGLPALAVLGVVVASALAGGLYAFAAHSTALDSRRDELLHSIGPLREGANAHLEAGTLVACGDEASARADVLARAGTKRMLDESVPADECLVDLGLPSYQPIYGAYWVEVDGDAYTIHGVMDLDGDGVLAEMAATRDDGSRITDGSVY